MFDIEIPESREQIRDALIDQEEEIAEYLGGLSIEEFFADQGRHWSPAGHMRHLNKSVRAVANGVRQTRIALMAFGRARGGSRSYADVVDTYRAALDAGGKAGKFGPSDRASDLPPDEWRLQIMDHWRDSNEQLRTALEGWSEKALDRYRLPHPLIGKLTLRELLFWTLYHNAHHARRIAERLERSQPMSEVSTEGTAHAEARPRSRKSEPADSTRLTGVRPKRTKGTQCVISGRRLGSS